MSMPWETTGQKFLSSFAGPTTKIVLTLGIIFTGWCFIHSRGDAPKERAIKVLIGGSISVGAVAIAAMIG